MANRRNSDGAEQGASCLAPQPDNADSIDRVLAGLTDLAIDQVRLQWRNHLGGIAPTHLPRWLLVRVLAYRIQAAALGDLDKGTLRIIRQSKGDDADDDRCRPFEKRGPAMRDGTGLKAWGVARSGMERQAGAGDSP